MREHGMRWHLMREIEERGAEAVIDDAIAEALDGPDAIYLSIDIDVLDPGMAPGTGTPEPGGLLTRELLRAVRRIVGKVELAAMDVVEVSPPYDHADITAAAAHRCVLEAISALAVKKRDGHTVRHEPDPQSRACRRAGAACTGTRPPVKVNSRNGPTKARARPSGSRALLRPRRARRARATSTCTWRSRRHRTGRSWSLPAARGRICDPAGRGRPRRHRPSTSIRTCSTAPARRGRQPAPEKPQAR